MIGSLGAFAALDANSKLLAGAYHVSQVMAVRYAVLLALLAAVLALGTVRPGLGASLRTRRPLLQLARAGCMIGSGTGFFLALRALPLAEGYLVYFTAPFLLLALFRVLLREPVPRSAWLWCAVGFGGVLLALWPGLAGGGDLVAYAWALLGTLAHALVLVLNRALRDEPGMARLILWTSGPALLVLAPWAATEWVHPTGRDWIALAANGLLAGAATIAIASAFRHASAGRLAPLEFTALVWAVLADIAIWGVWPSAWTWAGAVVVVFAGVMAQRREG